MRWWPFGRRAEQRAITYQDVWGSGGDVNTVRGDSIPTALSLIAVYAATRLIADKVATMPLEAFRRVGDTRARVPAPALLADPTAFGTTVDWLHRAVTSIALRGNAYGLVTSLDSRGAPARIEWLHPDDVSLEQDDTAYAPRWFWRGRLLDPNAFLHVPGYTLPGRVKGLSPIGAAKLTVETGLHAARFGRDWFENGSTPAAVLETSEEVTFDQAKVIKDRFKKAARGREPVALGMGVTYKPISVPADESQFLATSRAGKTDIANIFGIPAELIGGETGQSLTYSTQEQQQIQLVSNACSPFMVRLETAISRLLPRPQYVKFNADDALRADTATRYQAHHLALADGWMSKDEVRAVEDLPPLPNGEGATYTPTTQPARVPPDGGAAQ